jgi:hypothetical protein
MSPRFRTSRASRGLAVRRGTTLVATLLAIVAACDQGSGVVQTCSGIPTNGCPLLEDDSECEDPCCAAAYACVGGEWSLDHSCAGFDAGILDACSGMVGPAIEDAGTLRDVSDFDVPPGAAGGPSCIDPQTPDCWISEALLCNPNSIDPCCGCEALFYCQNGSTLLWGFCSDDGGITSAK